MPGWADEALGARLAGAAATTSLAGPPQGRPRRSSSPVSPVVSLLRSPRSPYSTAHGTDEGPPPVLNVLARLLEETVNGNELSGDGCVTLFCGLRPPAVPLAAYLARIFRYANCSPSCYVLAFIYLERLIQNDPQLRITSLSVHRLLSTAVLVATKFIDDSYYNNAYFAKIGGISLGEMNALEVEMLQRIDYRLHVHSEEFDAVCERLAGHLSQEELEAAEASWVASPAEAAGEQARVAA